MTKIYIYFWDHQLLIYHELETVVCALISFHTLPVARWCCFHVIRITRRRDSLKTIKQSKICYLRSVFPPFFLPKSAFISLTLRHLVNCFWFTDKLIMCETNVTNAVDLVEREKLWIQIAEQINQPALINNHPEPPKKWNFYNSFFVAVTIATTIGRLSYAPFYRYCQVFQTIGLRNYTATPIRSWQLKSVLKRQTSVSYHIAFYNLLRVSIFQFSMPFVYLSRSI